MAAVCPVGLNQALLTRPRCVRLGRGRVETDGQRVDSYANSARALAHPVWGPGTNGDAHSHVYLHPRLIIDTCAFGGVTRPVWGRGALRPGVHT